MTNASFITPDLVKMFYYNKGKFCFLSRTLESIKDA